MDSQNTLFYSQDSNEFESEAYYVENETNQPYRIQEMAYRNEDSDSEHNIEFSNSGEENIQNGETEQISRSEENYEHQGHSDAEPNITYKAQMEIDELNMNIGSQIKHLIMQKSKYDFEIRDVRRRLRQSEERYLNQLQALSEMRLLYEQSKNDLEAEKEQRSNIMADYEDLQATTEYVKQRQNNIENIWPEMQNYLQQQFKNNQDLQENITLLKQQLSVINTQRQNELAAYKTSQDDLSKKEILLSENIANLNEILKNKEEQILNMQQQYCDLDLKYQESSNANEMYESNIKALKDKIESLSNEYALLQEKYQEELIISEARKSDINTFKEKENDYLKNKEVLTDEIKKLKSNFATAESNHEKSIQEFKKKSESDSKALKDLANHIELCKAECEQKIKVEQSFAENQNSELRQQIEKLKEHLLVLEDDKNKEISTRDSKLADYDTLVIELNRNLSNYSQRLESKSNENMKLLQDVLQSKTTIKSLSDAKKILMDQIQSKNKHIEMLKTAHRLTSDRTAYVAPANVATSEASSPAKSVQQVYYADNRKRSRIVPKKMARLESTLSQVSVSEQPTQKFKATPSNIEVVEEVSTESSED